MGKEREETGDSRPGLPEFTRLSGETACTSGTLFPAPPLTLPHSGLCLSFSLSSPLPTPLFCLLPPSYQYLNGLRLLLSSKKLFFFLQLILQFASLLPSQIPWENYPCCPYSYSVSLHFLISHSLTLKSDPSTSPPTPLRLLLLTVSCLSHLTIFGPILPDL